MAKKQIIPKELSDKDMLAGYEEEESIDEVLERSKVKPAVKQHEDNGDQTVSFTGMTMDAGFTDALGKALLALKLELAQEGINKYQYKIKREGQSIIITPKFI